MRKISVLVGLFSTVLVLCAESRADTFFTYELAGYPNGPTGCLDVGKQIAERFERVTRIIPFGTKASDESGTTCRIRVTYAAGSELPVVSTAVDNIMAGKGAYPDRASCEASLSVEEARFTRLTGLSPVVSYCERAKDASNRPYVQRVESFGTPDTSIYYFSSVLVFGSAPADVFQIEARLKASFERLGYEVANLALRTSPGGWSTYLSFSYYARGARDFEVLPLFGCPSKEACEGASRDVDGFLSTAKSPVLGSFCVSKEAHRLFLLVQNPLRFSLKGPPDEEAYPSLSGCESDRARVEAAYTKIGWRVLGTACGVREDKMRMLVFAEKR